MTSAPLSQPPEPAPAFPKLALSVSGLALSRGDTVLAHDLALELGPGEAVLLTGRNGTGKTSLLRALAGFLEPDAGEITINGERPALAAADAIAWLGHADGLKPGESIRQALRFWADLHGVPRSAILPALRALEMDHLIDRPAARLSRGQQRRCALARVVLANRPLWLLDEPAGPLDGEGRACLATLVATHRARGGLVIAATHQPLDWPDARSLDMGRL
ncbi:heme ABC exporter ATP-binding protein CcmA [uncultured Maricaulis sp.]|uniref:heme ABC exporter ATP-binding protein CcmA n=1 Tax=uncultured Maricaulis sp. TaxID=174710 RepID=UPI0030D7A84E|tara:strand:+ start:27492 stop:28148 length:657 start_codon:yes stop_codon:yes gene_type:complete